jgi:hypothetical protein
MIQMPLWMPIKRRRAGRQAAAAPATGIPRSGIIIALAVNGATAANNDDRGALAGSVYQTLQKADAVHAG